MKKVLFLLIFIMVFVNSCSLIDRTPPEYVWCDYQKIQFDIECYNNTGSDTAPSFEMVYISKNHTFDIDLTYSSDWDMLDEFIDKKCYPLKGRRGNTKTLEYLC